MGLTLGFKCLSPLPRLNRICSSILGRKHIESSEKMTFDHRCLFNLICRMQNRYLKALRRRESFFFRAGFPDLKPPDRIRFVTLWTDTECAQSTILSQPQQSLKAWASTSVILCNGLVTSFLVCCDFRSLRPGSVLTELVDFITLSKSQDSAAVNSEQTGNICD